MAEISPLRRRMIEDMTVRNLSPATTQRRFFGNLAALAEPEAPHGLNSFDASIGSFAKPSFGGPEQVLAYLGRYTHCVASPNFGRTKPK
jgi:hypothetical protein